MKLMVMRKLCSFTDDKGNVCHQGDRRSGCSAPLSMNSPGAKPKNSFIKLPSFIYAHTQVEY